MNTGGEAAEQIVRMSLEGFEVAAKITGAGAKNIAILLYSILKEEKKTKGKARLTSMLRSGKELKVFTVKSGDLKKFTQEAKKYGVLYCVLTDRKNKDPNAEVDVIARAEDASKISRIVERFNLASVDTASIVTEAEKSKDAKDGQSEPDIGVQEKAEKDKLLDELMGKPVQKEENAPNPSVAKTEKSPQSEPISEQPKKSAEGATMTKEKPSVREELRKIKESRKEQKAEIDTSALNKSGASDRAKSANGKTEHKQPQRKKKKPKFKETRKTAMSIYDVFSGGNRPFDKEEWAAAKQAQRKEAYELIDNTCSEMMASGDSFRQYLDVQGSFDRYSVANAILVSAQMPEATQLKEYSKWKANRVYVNKDAQKIIILEPSKEYTREDGTKGISYNAKVVYDISETSAKDRQQEQEPKSMRELVSALIDASPVPCVPVGELELPAYYDSSQQTIFVKKGLSEEVLFVSMAKEVSAAVYDFKYNESRDASDFKSFCVAYMVSSRYGVDTKGFDFSRLPSEYAEMDTQAFKGELGTMRDVLGEIQSDMYKSMEKNKPAKNKEQER